jgi:DNA-binding transcriptional MerR regulator
MELYEIAEIADRLGLPANVVRSYRDRYLPFIPVVRVGRHLRYPAEAIDVIADIHRAVQIGATTDEIEAALQARFPITVITAQGVESRVSGRADDALRTANAEEHAELRSRLDDLRGALGGLASYDEVQALRAEIASLAAVLTQRDFEVEHARAVAVADLREVVSILRQEIAALRAETIADRCELAGATESRSVDAPDADGERADRVTTPSGAQDQLLAGRTPRRMGQPLRANGLP